jgi:hypothetical protein
LHLGNIIYTPQKTLGLIDLSDIRLYRQSLGRFRRQRNLRHMLRYPEEAEWLVAQGEFLAAYRMAAAQEKNANARQ